ncbi:MAG: FAD-binding protein [Bacteroidales bacterium]|nr:FAD-binding protein [Bacteroidales bacterium]
MEKEKILALDALINLQKDFEGEIVFDNAINLMYATDASAYREVPLAVTFPKNKSDLKKLIQLATRQKVALIPRAAGTSLAGQVVGNGIVVDISKHMTRILEVNQKERWVRVEPGVVRDELNKYLEDTELFFAPETSTSNRAMIGGMLGNNSCGAHSLVYGSTRDHTLEATVLLSDGSEVVFGNLNKAEFQQKTGLSTLEGKLYKQIQTILDNPENQIEIKEQYPDLSLERRNTGYALDLLLNTEFWTKNNKPFNFCTLLAGSEGTLAFTTEIKLNLEPLPSKHKGLVCVHLETIPDSLKANLFALEFRPHSIELMDKTIMELTKENIEQRKNRFFVQGNPGAVLIVEFIEESMTHVKDKAKQMEEKLRSENLGYHFPLVTGNDMNKVWNLRKAGLGILNNMVGDAKPVALIEDTAVHPRLLPDYIKEFEEILKKYNKDCVYYAHIATGELHLRPVMNLKDPKEVELFYQIGRDTALLVKKYNGSLSGEHGDGRLRGEFIPLMVGKKIYRLFKEVKQTWDPNHIFNPGKITDTPKMNTSLRYEPGQKTPEIKTYFDFIKDQGIVRAAEKCNGTGECRKTSIMGGTMCPSYMATRDEDKTTRARANVLREFLSRPNQKNPFDHKEVYQVLDMCLMCKACKSECPSSVDITKLKAEFLQHYYDIHGIPLRTRLIANISKMNQLGSLWPGLYNFIQSNTIISSLNARILGFAEQRHFPLLGKEKLDSWFVKYQKKNSKEFPNGKVYLFNDEFTRFNDTDTGIKAILLLNKLGYEVIIPKHLESARTYLSKGLVKKAQQIARTNVLLLKDKVSESTPLVGIEPSAILTFRDEYIDLLTGLEKRQAQQLAQNALMIDEFLAREMKAGKIRKEQFTNTSQHIKLHGHCHQKSLASTEPTKFTLSFPANYTVEEIPSGCCGMAGSFGYEKEHYELSMKVGEMVLFPAVRNSNKETIIAAPGTSCRNQIKDGTQRNALHPIDILFEALINY